MSTCNSRDDFSEQERRQPARTERQIAPMMSIMQDHGDLDTAASRLGAGPADSSRDLGPLPMAPPRHEGIPFSFIYRHIFIPPKLWSKLGSNIHYARIDNYCRNITPGCFTTSSDEYINVSSWLQLALW
jgi:hypothetical protein